MPDQHRSVSDQTPDRGAARNATRRTPPNPPSAWTTASRSRRGPYVDDINTSFDIIPRHARRESHEIHLSRQHVTRDSMVESMLLSFNQIAPKSLEEITVDRSQQQPAVDDLLNRDYRALLQDDSSADEYLNSTSANPSDLDPMSSSTKPPDIVIPPRKHGKGRHQALVPASPVATQEPGTPTQSRPQPAQSASESERKHRVRRSMSNPTNPQMPMPRSPPSQPAERGSIVDSTLTSSPRSLGQSIRSSIVETTPPRGKSSGSAAFPGSILDRARPVPSDYHDFSGSLMSRDSQALAAHARKRTSSSTKAAAAAAAAANMADRQNQALNAAAHLHLGSASHDRRGNDLAAYSSRDQSDLNRNGTTASGKSKPGFFKRVFGNAPKQSSTQQSWSHEPPQLPPLTMARDDPRGNRTPLESAQRTPERAASYPKMPAVPTEDDDAKEQPSQSLNKKASFFRRKKKASAGKDASMSDPNLLTRHDTQPSTENTTPASTKTIVPSSSISSLRKVMVPFLNEADTNRQNDKTGNLYTFGSRSRSQSPSKRRSRAQRGDSMSKIPGDRSSRVTEAPPRPSTSARPEDLRADLDYTKTGLVDKTNTADSKVPAMPSHRTLSKDLRSNTSSSPQLRTWDLAPKSSQSDTPSIPTSPVAQRLPKSSTVPSVTSPVSPTSRRSDFSGNPIPLISPPTSAVTDTKSNNVYGGMRSLSHASQQSHRTASQSSSQHNPGEVLSSPEEIFQSATSLPLVQVDGESTAPSASEIPTEADRQQAQAIFDQQDDPIGQARAATVLGEQGPVGQRVRTAYMQFYDFTGQNILLGLRELCEKLALKGETQQVDRILDAFSRRWCECNPNHGFKSPDTVHAICYSILLLNTDLHMADVESKMTRNQFIKNTIPAVRAITSEESDKDATIRAQSSAQRGSVPWREIRSPSPSTAQAGVGFHPRSSMESTRVDSRINGRPLSEMPLASPTVFETRNNDSSTLLVHAPFDGPVKAWENAVESVLKDFYSSIRNERLPLHGASKTRLQEQNSSASLNVGSILRRSGSVISKTPSESARGRPQDPRNAGGSRWTSKTRSRPNLYPPSTFTSSRTGSRTSLESPATWTPGGSSIWSKSYFGGLASNAMSTDSLASRFTRNDERYQQSIGFANALSHAIIREEGGMSSVYDEEDDEIPAVADLGILELAGAPWAKEGIVQHKHHLETTDKRAKDRAWAECFAVIEKGTMRLFSFNSKASIKSQKANNKINKGAVVGGGNWTENAEAIGTFLLRQTIANALPPPGYSKSRPHVFALSLPTGAVHLFQVGTPEIAKEFVSTANYWSSRLSKEPLVGGVSNVEYGWGDAILNNPENRSATPTSMMRQQTTHSSSQHRPSNSISAREGTMSHGSRSSFQGSIRSTILDSTGSSAAKKPADRAALSEWLPPQQSLMASGLSEEEQLEGLKQYVRDVEEELSKHNELRGPMAAVYAPRSTNAARAANNWERKSSYLLKEIVKYGTYVDALEAARKRAGEIRKEQEVRDRERERRERKKRGEVVDDSEDEDDGDGVPAETREALRLARSASPNPP